MKLRTISSISAGLLIALLAGCGGSSSSGVAPAAGDQSPSSSSSTSSSRVPSTGSSGSSDSSGSASSDTSGPCQYMDGVTSAAYALHDLTTPDFPTAHVKSPDTCEYTKDGVILDVTITDGESGYAAAPGAEFDSAPDLLPALHVDTIYKWDDASKTISQFAGGKSVVGVFGPAATTSSKDLGMSLVKFLVFKYKGSR